MQPRPGPIRLFAGRASRLEPLGRALRVPSFEDGLRSIDVELRRRAEAGELLRVGTEDFEVEYRFDAVEDWDDFLDNPHAAGLQVDTGRLREATAALRRGDGLLAAVEEWTATGWRTPSR